jgi:phage shock protein A
VLQARRHLAEAIAEEERLHQRREECLRLAGRWQQRAALALSKGLEALAQQAVERRLCYQALSEAYRLEYEEQRRHVSALKRELAAVETGIVIAGRAGPAHPSGRPHWSECPPRRRESVARASTGLAADPVADRLAALERSETLERQLAELKRRLGQRSDTRA